MCKLGVNYLDMVLLHWPLGNVYAAWRVLEDYYRAGKIRAIGVSNMDPDRVIDLITFNEMKPVLNQIETHLYCQRQSDRQWMKKYDVAVQAYAPLGQGRAKQMFSEAEVQNLAAKYSKTPAQILLRFLTQLNVSVIPKSVQSSPKLCVNYFRHNIMRLLKPHNYQPPQMDGTVKAAIARR